MQVTEDVNSVTYCRVIAVMLLTCKGNEYIHAITYAKRHRLRIDLTDWEGNAGYAEYDNFKVGSEHEKYKLISLGHYHGNVGRYIHCGRKKDTKMFPVISPIKFGQC